MNRFNGFGAILAAVWVGVVLSACGDDDTGTDPPVCGDGVCEAAETATGCPSDCGCGNGVLNDGEACDGVEFGTDSCTSYGFVAGVLHCNADCTVNANYCCDHGCATSGETQCASDVVQVCETAADTCRYWVDQADCGAANEECVLDGTTARCTVGCTNTCPADGDEQCNGTAIEICSTSLDGCLSWVETTDCADASEICEDALGTPQCSASCLDGCTPNGSTDCNGAVLQTCEVQGDGCTDWVDTTDCAASGEDCIIDGAAARCTVPCTDGCTPDGVTQCLGDVIQTCSVGLDGCLLWQDTTDCATGGEICEDALGTPICSATCIDECTTPGSSLCAGTVVQSCVTQTDGCHDMVDGVDCAPSGQVCSDTTGTAQCCLQQCPTLGAQQCNGNTIEICVQGSVGCYEWALDTTCPVGEFCTDPGTGPVCDVVPITGEDCTVPVTLDSTGVNAIDPTSLEANTLDVLFDSLIDTACCSNCTESGTGDTVFQFTASSVNAEISLDKTSSNRLVMMVVDDCLNPTQVHGCWSDFTPTTLSMPVSGLVPGNTYYLLIRHGYSSAIWPDPLTTYISIDSTICGNSTVQSTEECDDGNLNPGDGCDANCLMENGWYCTGQPSVCQPDYAITTAVYSWIELSTSVTATSVVLDDDEEGGPYAIGFPFAFYGNTYSDVYIASNGYLTFTPDATLWSDHSNTCPIVDAFEPNDIIALVWDDLDPALTDLAYYEHFPVCPIGTGQCFVAQYQAYHYYSSGANAGTFQAVLFDNGSIQVQWLDAGVDAGLYSTTGIEGATGTVGQTHVCDTAASLQSLSAICFEAPGSGGC